MGAVYFAVCGGKLSEGIDFTDSMARAVFIIGIPFPNTSSLKTKSKKNYLDW
jgi:Rad3-related DNA helicase